MVTAEGLVAQIDDLGCLPAIYGRLTDVINQPRSSVNDIAEVMSEDAGLTARVLRLVNSSLFSYPSEISTVPRAITIVGTQQLLDLTLATSVLKLFDEVPQEAVEMESFWRHNIACAISARYLAIQRRASNAERFFVAGLLHDVGSLILYQKAAEEASRALQVCREEARPLHLAEQEVLGFDHATVGGALLEAWGLPAVLCEAVAMHHSPRKASRFPEETAVTHVAEVIADGLGLGTNGDPRVPPLCSATWNGLGLDAETVPIVIYEVERLFEETVSMFLTK